MEEENRETGDGWSGCAIVFGCNFLALTLSIGSGYFIQFILFIGVIQLIYIIPLIIVAKRKGKTGLVKGMAIGAGVVFLLQSLCYGML